MQRIFVVTLGLLASYVTCHPRGAPITACDSMYPLHKHDPQITPCPFETRPLETEISSDSRVKIALHASALSHPASDSGSSGSSSSSESGTTVDFFKGYMIMAFEKYTKNMTAIGTFEVTHGSHTIDCHGMLNNAATHSSNTHKNIVHLTWIPPAGFEGDIVFKTTYVASKKLFWIEQFSVPVHVKSSSFSSRPRAIKTNKAIVKNITASLKFASEEVDITEVDYFVSSQYFSLWVICCIFVVGFTCAVVTKLVMAVRPKKYDSVQSI